MKIKTGKQILESGAQEQLATGIRKVLELNELCEKYEDVVLQPIVSKITCHSELQNANLHSEAASMHQQLCQELQRENVDLIVQSSLSAKERHLAAVASALWRHFFSFLKSQRMSQIVPLSQLADAAADFTLLAMDLPSTAPSDLQPQPVTSMIQLFGWDDIVWPQVVARYLSHFLQNSMLCEALSHSGCVSFQALTIRSWIRCILQMYIKNLYVPDDSFIDLNTEQAVEKDYMEQLAELTRLLLKLSEVKNILSKAHVEYLPIQEGPKKALVVFLEAVGITYGNLQTLSDKSAMVTKSLEYLGEILKYIKPYLGKKISSAGLQLTYMMMGTLVKSWAQIFATSKAQKLLFRIIDCLLLPHTVLQQEKELPAPMLTAIQKSLPLYLQGMCIVCCQSQNPNAYLTQLLGNVIEQKFIEDYGMRYDYQIYSILETVAALDQQVVIHLISTLTQSLKSSERKWGLGRNIAQREAYSKLLSHLGQVGQDEIQRLKDDNIESIL
eukprot:bmy_09373T0